MSENYDGNTRPHWSPYGFLVTGTNANIDNFPNLIAGNSYLEKFVFEGKGIEQRGDYFNFQLFKDPNIAGQNNGTWPKSFEFDWKPCCKNTEGISTSTWYFRDITNNSWDKAGHVVYELNKLNNNTPEELEKLIVNEYQAIIDALVLVELDQNKKEAIINDLKRERDAKIQAALAAQKALRVTIGDNQYENKFTFTLNPLMIASQQRTGNGPTFRTGPYVNAILPKLPVPQAEKNHLVRIGFNPSETEEIIYSVDPRTPQATAFVPPPPPKRSPTEEGVNLANQSETPQSGIEAVSVDKPSFQTRNIGHGDGVTVVILDTSPTKPDPNNAQVTIPSDEVFATGLVDYWADPATPYFKKYPNPSRTAEEKDPDKLVPPKLKSFPAWGQDLVPASTPGAGETELDHDDMQKYHGLLVASLVRQVAPKAKIMLLRVLDDQGEAPNTLVTAALDLVCRWTNDATNPLYKGSTKLVINLSLGAYESMSEIVDYEKYLTTTNCLCENGAVIVAAAGNFSFKNHPFNPWEPAAFGYYDDTLKLNSNLITVAATDLDYATRYAWFSNQGILGAPGCDILTDLHTKVKGHQKGAAVGQLGAEVEAQTFKWSGTSFAAPLVTGAAALLLGEGVNNSDVKRILWDTATLPTDWNGIRELNLFEAFNHSITQKVIANTKPMTATQVEPVSEQ